MKPDTIKSWAIARSIYKGVSFSKLHPDCIHFLYPKLLSEKLISMGDGNNLVFSKKNLFKIHEKRFAVPELIFILRNPYSCFKKIQLLKKFGNYIYSQNSDLKYLSTLMAVSLEATVVYMNNHFKCLNIMGDESGVVSFFLQGFDLPLINLIKNQENKWSVSEGSLDHDSRVSLTFKNIDIGIKSCLGKINPLAGATLGEYKVNGYLPLMDKVGYCARMVGKELPLII